MKFVHIADIHFDSPFVNLSDREKLGDLKRLEQRKVFKKVIEFIKENKIEFLFIAGDLYEHKYIKQTTIEYINKLFKEIPETKVFITPGNHDPNVKNSFYKQFNWNENVKIFDGNIEKVELENIDIYGYGFDDFYCINSNIEELEISNKDKLNILIIHGTLDGANIEDKQYNSMSKKMLEEKGFDYIALGHIHKPDYNTYEEQNIVYPGSMISLGFDEVGDHGIIVGDLSKSNLKLEFKSLNESEFVEKHIDITNIFSKEELIEIINEVDIKENELVKIILTGKRNFEINVYDLYKLIFNEKIIKIKDQTKLNYNLNEIGNDSTLKGLFAKEMLEKLNDENVTDEERKILEKAIEIGFESLE